MPENTPFKDFWTLFVISSTGIPPRASPSDPALSFNLKYEFLKRGAGATEEPVLSLTLSDDSVVFKNEKTGETSTAVSPQCGPYCSTYPGGFFAFWMTYDSKTKKYVISVENNSKKLTEVSSEVTDFSLIRPCQQCKGTPDSQMHSVWKLFGAKLTPEQVATTTTTSTKTPWQDQVVETCPISRTSDPCRGTNVEVSPEILEGDVLWIDTSLKISNPKINKNGREYWQGFLMKKDTQDVFSLLLDDKYIIIHIEETGNEYSSPYTNQSLAYIGRDISIGVGKSRYGYFILDENLGALITLDINGLDLSFNKAYPLSSHEIISTFRLQTDFLLPQNKLFIGYETCSINEDCVSATSSCTSQALEGLCQRRSNTRVWTVEVEVAETHVNNGTWTDRFALDGLLSTYFLGSPSEPLYNLLFFGNRIVIEDLDTQTTCSGAYSTTDPLTFGQKILWSFGVDEDSGMIYFNTAAKDDPSHFKTVCSMPYLGKRSRITRVYPLGYAPSKGVFTQSAAGLPQGGFETTSSNSQNGGFYFPDKNTTTGHFEPENKYGESFPFYPLGVKPAPLDGDDSNTPPNYHYNSTTSQFEPNHPSPGELNPFRPTHIVDGNSICDLYLFSTCNATSARIMPENTPFKSGWTLFVILSTGVPVRRDDAQAPKSVIYNYRYNFIRTLAKGGAENGASEANTEEVVMSLSLSNETVVFRNEKTNTEQLVAAPQCGPYCSTYPGGFFAFWLTYDSKTNKYVISVENNSKKLVELDAGDTQSTGSPQDAGNPRDAGNPQEIRFDKVVAVMDGDAINGQKDVEKTFSVWHLFNRQRINTEVSVTTTTTTQKPWYETELEECPLELASPCRGQNAVIKDSKFNKGNLIWISMSTVKSSPEIVQGSSSYWHGFSFYRKDDSKVLSILFNETHLRLEDALTRTYYSSRYTNSSMNYVGETVTVGLGWSRLGLFLINDHRNSFVEIKNSLDYSFVKLRHDSTEKKPSSSNYLLEDNFLYPDIPLFKGYETCGLFGECSVSPVACNSQVLKEVCLEKVPGMYWTFENVIQQTHVSNGTWGAELILDGLLNVYQVNDGFSDLLSIYFFDNRAVLLDLENKVSCSGPYPLNKKLNISSQIKWSIGFGKNYLLYLNIYDLENHSKAFTVCNIRYDASLLNIEFVYPLGFAPSMAKFTQYKSGFPIRGFDSTSSNSQNGGFYFPDKNTTTNELMPENKYGESFPFYPPGVKPAPLDGDDSNTPPNYHYNSTTSQFEPNSDHPSPGELNPFRPTHIVDGNSICDLYLFSTCNATSARIMPENIPFKSGWTLFVILSTGVPVRRDDAQASKSVIYNYRYNFIRTLAKGGAEDVSGVKTEEVVMSLSLSNQTVVFRNEKTKANHLVGAPQCGPYCSTYPGGFFAFWLTYDSRSRRYVISVENNSQKLVELDVENPEDLAFNKVAPCCGAKTDLSYSTWQLIDSASIPASQATTSTTTTSTASTESQSSASTEIPWQDVELEDCPLDMSSPCKGMNSTLTSPDSFGEGNLLWLSSTVSESGGAISIGDLEVLKSYHFKDQSGVEILVLGLNLTHITLIDQRSSRRYASYYTNQTLVYPTASFKLGLGWSRLGVFILDEHGDGLIHLKSDKRWDFAKIEQNQDLETITIYEWSKNFIYPRELLFLGYSICSAFNDCGSDSLSCSAQAVGDLCSRRKTSISWDVEFTLTETHVGNGTWGPEFELPGLVNTYFVSNDHQPVLAIYFFETYMALLDLETSNICSGPYPESASISPGDQIKWSIDINNLGATFLNIESWKGPHLGTHFTVCTIGPVENRLIGGVKYIHPLGYSPSISKFTQNKKTVSFGGFDSTSSSQNGGFYFPDKNTTTNELMPENKYGESFPFYPPGVKPAPIDGDDSNTPPNYHYNSTTSQFEPNSDHPNPEELNPFRPTHIVDGNSICDLYLFSTCNATSARIMPENIMFEKDWTLFVILSTGVPVREDDAHATNGVIYSYRYEFIRTVMGKGGAENGVSGVKTEEVVMSLSLSNETVMFRNEKTNTDQF
ncbi:mucin-like protein, partial [Cryptosporidium canis]